MIEHSHPYGREEVRGNTDQPRHRSHASLNEGVEVVPLKSAEGALENRPLLQFPQMTFLKSKRSLPGSRCVRLHNASRFSPKHPVLCRSKHGASCWEKALSPS